MSVAPLRVFRLRVVLDATAPVKLHSFHGPAVYALLAAASGRSRGIAPALPDGLMPDVPEQCRVRIGRGEPYAFGLTLLAADPAAAAGVVRPLLAGLAALGDSAGPRRPAWGGNFRVAAVEDLVAGGPLADAPVPIDSTVFDHEAAALADHPRLTLRFTTPLRVARPKSKSVPGHGFYDRDYFDPAAFLVRQWNRLAALGFVAGDPPPTDGVTVVENRLVWLDVSYGFATDRKRLGGVAGWVGLDGVPAAWRRELAVGQYVRAGLNTRFGFGAYRVADLGPDPYPCRRAIYLTSAAARAGLEPLLVDAPLAHQLGLTRPAAGQVLAAHFANGYRWAGVGLGKLWTAVPVAEMQDRLLAALGDDDTAASLAVEPWDGLAPLFADELARLAGSAGVRIGRWGDDGLVLTRTQAEAERWSAVGRVSALWLGPDDALELRPARPVADRPTVVRCDSCGTAAPLTADR